MFHQRLLASQGIRQYSCMLFPGQGAQYVGMTSKIQTNPAVQSLFKRANDILGYDLQSLCLNEPEHTLRKTEYCQPAIVVSSLAAAAVHNHEQNHAVAGFSVGEMTALIFTRAISFQEGLHLVATRARAMQSASDTTPSSLVRIFGMDSEHVEGLCEEVMVEGLGDASIAIKLFTKGHVIACSKQAENLVGDKTRAAGGIAEVLQLSGGFHSSYMSSAVEDFTAAVNNASLTVPTIPVYSNVTGKPFTSIEDMKRLVTQQLTCRVSWNELICNMRSDYPNCHFVECGPGNQLHFLLKKIDRKIKCTNYSA